MAKGYPDVHAFPSPTDPSMKGITLREYIASIALHGLISNEGYTGVSAEAVANRAIDLANSLVEKLYDEQDK